MYKSERIGKYVVSYFIDLECGCREVKVSENGILLRHHLDFNYDNDTNVEDVYNIAKTFLKELNNK